MNAAHSRVSETRKSWSERIKTWLGTTNRRPATKNTFQPRLESLEARDVPSSLGGAINQICWDTVQIQPNTLHTAYTNSIVNTLIQLYTANSQNQPVSVIGQDVHNLSNLMLGESASSWYVNVLSDNITMQNDLFNLVVDYDQLVHSNPGAPFVSWPVFPHTNGGNISFSSL